MEAELVERARQREVEAFALLVQIHTPGLYHFLRSRLQNPQLAEDLTQEAFLRAWQAIDAFRSSCSFRSWLYRIAWNLMLTEAGRRKREIPWDDGFLFADPASGNPTERLEHEAERREVQSALTALAPEDRELVRMLYQDELSYAEISELLGLPLGTVKTRLHRARGRMRAHLESQWEVAAK